MTHENQRIVLTKRLFKEALLTLLEEKSLDKINVTELCRASGLNRATFYRHYDIPQDVMNEVQKDIYRELRDRIPIPTSMDEVKPCIRQIFQYMDDKRNLFQTLFRSCSDMDFLQFINDIFLTLWTDTKAFPFLKKYNPEEIRHLCIYHAGGSYFLLRQWTMGTILKTPEEITEDVYVLLNKMNQDFLAGTK